MVTAEIAVALPVFVVLIAVALSAVAVISGQLRCVDGAREAARALARGESVSAARSLAAQAAPHSSVVSSTAADDRVRVEVAETVRPIGGLLPGFTVHATAVALREPDGADPP